MPVSNLGTGRRALRFVFAGGLPAVFIIWGALFGSAVSAAQVSVIDSNATIVLPSDGSTYRLSSGSVFDQLSIGVGASSFSFAIPSGASLTITSLDSDRALDNTLGVSTVCGSNTSSLTISNTTGGSETAIVTPGGTCVSTVATPSVPQDSTRVYGQSHRLQTRDQAALISPLRGDVTISLPAETSQLSSSRSLPTVFQRPDSRSSQVDLGHQEQITATAALATSSGGSTTPVRGSAESIFTIILKAISSIFSAILSFLGI